MAFRNSVYDVKEAMQLAGLDWTVSKTQLFLPNPDGTFTPVPKVYGVVRETDRKVLGTVGNVYEVLQNYEQFRIFEPFIGEGNWAITDAVAFGDGEQIGIKVEMPDNEMNVTKNDTVKGYQYLIGSHDSRYSTTILNGRNRPLCTNILRSNVAESIKIRHTSKQHEKLEEVQISLQKLNEQFYRDVKLYKTMANTPMSDQDFRSYLERCFEKELVSAKKRSDNPDQFTLTDYKPTRIILWNYESIPDIQLEGVKGTMWGGFNAITNFITHQKGGKGFEERADKILLGNDARFLEQCTKFALV